MNASDLTDILEIMVKDVLRTLDAELAILFKNDETTGELWASGDVGQGPFQIRCPNDRGLAGEVFTSGRAVMLPVAYADPRFNPAFDKQTGFFTRNILCAPIWAAGKVDGVVQVLNKRGGPFTEADERHLRSALEPVEQALTACSKTREVENSAVAASLQATMLRHLDPSVADTLLDDSTDLLGGKTGVATVMFTELRDFSVISAELGAQATMSLLSDYFTLMMESISREGGMLDKFIGDGMMAAFGMPIVHQDDPDRAVRASISMLRDLANWNSKRVAANVRPLDMGIGLNTDTVAAGNIGSPKRMSYTLVGEGVNIAARLRDVSRRYAAHLLIGEYTYLRLNGSYRMREVDRVAVKWKAQTMAIYEVLDHHTDASFPNLPDALSHFQSGLSYYRDRNWDRSIDAFGRALRANPADGLPRLYIDRCEFFKSKPPGSNWNGAWPLYE